MAEWMHDHVADALAVLAALAVVDGAMTVWHRLAALGAVGVAAVLVMLAIALVLVVVATSERSVADYAEPLGLAAVAAITGSYLLAAASPLDPGWGTDALLFTRAGVDALLAGTSPYSVDMTGAWERYGAAVPGTPTVAGGLVGSYSYPAGALWVHAIPAALGLPLATVAVIATMGVVAILVWASPGALALAPLPLALLWRSLPAAALGGVIDGIWVLPALLAAVAFSRRRYWWGAVAIGLATTMKQQAWLLVPFLVVWVVADTDTVRAGLRRGTTIGGIVLGTFAAVNLPLVVMAPQAWLEGVFVALIGPTMVAQGIGPAMLTVTGVFPTTADWQFGLFAGVTLVAGVAYWLSWPRYKWTAWVAPALLVLPHRSLPSYLVWVLPLAYYAALQRGREVSAG